MKINLLIIVFFSLKLLAFLILFDTNIISGDAEYYDSIAKGEDADVVNLWALFLLKVGNYDLYNRDFYAIVIFFIGALILPIQFCNIIKKISKSGTSIIAAFWILTYPAIIVFSMDIYRDVILIVFLFLAIQYKIKIYDFSKLKDTIIFIIICTVAYFLRPYLGFSLIAASLLTFLKINFTYNRTFKLIIIVILISLIYKNELLNPIIYYRGVNGFEEGGSSFGITLYNLNIFEFILNYLLSFFKQLFGLSFPNNYSYLFFIFESIPFIYMLTKIYFTRLKNKIEIFLFNLFLIYSFIWILGNDNLGTAIRLRIISYIIISLIYFSKFHLENKKFKYI
jgi:hypothetical protein